VLRDGWGGGGGVANRTFPLAVILSISSHHRKKIVISKSRQYRYSLLGKAGFAVGMVEMSNARISRTRTKSLKVVRSSKKNQVGIVSLSQGSSGSVVGR
jgi:hypothetical protein